MASIPYVSSCCWLPAGLCMPRSRSLFGWASIQSGQQVLPCVPSAAHDRPAAALPNLARHANAATDRLNCVSRAYIYIIDFACICCYTPHTCMMHPSIGLSLSETVPGPKVWAPDSNAGAASDGSINQSISRRANMCAYQSPVAYHSRTPRSYGH